MIYEGYRDHRGRTGQSLVFFYFPANCSTNPDVFFSLKHCASQGKPSKFQLAWVRRFGGVRGQTSKQTDSPTDWRGAFIE